MGEQKATKQFKMTEHERELNRKRVANFRARKKAEKEQPSKNNAKQNRLNKEVKEKSSYSMVIERFNKMMSTYGNGMTLDNWYDAFLRAGENYANRPSVLNRTIKSVPSLPVDYTKEEIGEFLRNPYEHEKALRQTSAILRWTAYPYYKITKTYQDIPTYHYCTTPLYITEKEAQSEEYKREERLLDKLNKELAPEREAHKITGQAVSHGKVFYYLRTKIDKSHNHINHAFLQQLPTDYCTIVGENNKSGWTVAFDLMYFMQEGTDPLRYGDLFVPYLNDFNEMFAQKDSNGRSAIVNCKGGTLNFYFENVKTNVPGNPRVVNKGNTWYYWVTLPIDKVYVFEIDDTTAAVASPLSGLMLTYSQQSDYESAQMSLLLNPLLMLFTGEIPYFTDNGATTDDGFRLSNGARKLFETLFDELMASHNASGTAFFSAPAQNIKSHTFPEVNNANEIATSYNKYAIEKSGLGSIIPLSDPKAGQANLSALLEGRYSNCIYKQFERMMNNLYESLNLNFEWKFTMFGSIYTDDTLRENLEKRLANGDTSVYPYLAAMDGQSMLDKLSVMYSVKGSGFLDMLTPPATSYTQSANGIAGQDKEIGRPKNETTTEGSEKTEDSGS